VPDEPLFYFISTKFIISFVYAPVLSFYIINSMPVGYLLNIMHHTVAQVTSTYL